MILLKIAWVKQVILKTGKGFWGKELIEFEFFMSGF